NARARRDGEKRMRWLRGRRDAARLGPPCRGWFDYAVGNAVFVKAGGGRARMRRAVRTALALLQPAVRVDRAAVAAQFEIQRRATLAAGVADAGDRLAALDAGAGVLEQRIVVGVQAHVAVAVVDDQDQAVAGHPFGEHHGAVGDGLDR